VQKYSPESLLYQEKEIGGMTEGTYKVRIVSASFFLRLSLFFSILLSRTETDLSVDVTNRDSIFVSRELLTDLQPVF